MLKIGLTGGIASGKSTVSHMLFQIGIPVIDADVAARKVVERGTTGLLEITKTFGDVLQEDGSLDRKKLGAIIFKEEEKRKQLNAIVHPRVREWMQDQMAIYESKQTPCVVLDIPLLIESRLSSWCDRVLLVYVTPETQVKRLMLRDQINDEEARLRIQAQMPLEEKKALCDRLINNEGSILETREQLLAVLDDWGIKYNS